MELGNFLPKFLQGFPLRFFQKFLPIFIADFVSRIFQGFFRDYFRSFRDFSWESSKGSSLDPPRFTLRIPPEILSEIPPGIARDLSTLGIVPGMLREIHQGVLSKFFHGILRDSMRYTSRDFFKVFFKFLLDSFQIHPRICFEALPGILLGLFTALQIFLLGFL